MDSSDRLRASVTPHRVTAPQPAVRPPDPATAVIFGATGDLSRRKLVPALAHLQAEGGLPERHAIVGVSRTPMTDESFRETMLSELRRCLDPGSSADAADRLVRALYYEPGDAADPRSYRRLRERLERLDRELELPGNRIFYLAVSPELFPAIVENLHRAGLVRGRQEQAWSRVIIEKPFGRDLESARALNEKITSILDESQIYRIDHYLGKETVQNILSFRFGNAIFEPLFDRKYVDHVQITVAETVGMEGRRGAYFDTAGTLRDMVQNHMLQLLCLIAMEPPSALDARSIRDEKVKVLRALEPMTREQVAARTVRGQYGAGELDGAPVRGYRQEEGVDPESSTETYAALRLEIDNWRWAGVPFFLRSGKRLRKRVSEIAVEFKEPPKHLFRELDLAGDSPARPKSNLLVLRIQPNEGISLSFACKEPGIQFRLVGVQMDFDYGEAFPQRTPRAYERLLLDAWRGDASLFTRSDEIECAWRFVTSILEGWASLPPPAFPNYSPFSDGPEEAARLMAGTGATWRRLEDM